MIDAAGKDTYYAYDGFGRTTYTWGDTAQPTWVEYTPYGEREKLHTYRAPATGWDGTNWPGGANDGDMTTWEYHGGTGLLEKKTYADGTSVDYEYTPDGQLFRRLWARTVGGQRVTTTYGHDPRTSELLTTTYSDGTPNITMTYDRRGRLATVAQSGSYGLNYSYDYTQWPTAVSVTTSGLYAKTVTQTFDPAKGGALTEQAITGEYAADYFYNAQTGRLDRVTGPGLPTGTGNTHGAGYAYLANSDLLEQLTYRGVKGGSEIDLLRTTRAFEAHRDIVTTVTHVWTQGTDPTLALYDYRHPNNPDFAADDLGRRVALAYSGLAFALPVRRAFSYGNGRNELTSVDQWTGGGVYDGSWTYNYDPIGNRTLSRAWNEPDAANRKYVGNALNQYTQVRLRSDPEQFQTYGYDADGNLANIWLAADMNCDGAANFADINPFIQAVSDPTAWHAAYPSCNILNGDINGDGSTGFADINPLVALLNKNNGVTQLYTWDAENRLTRVEPTPGTTLAEGAQRVSFAYDHAGRRVWKQVETYTAGVWNVTQRRKFVWQDWLMLAELEGGMGVPPVDTVVRQYTWGLDLAGQNGGQTSGLSALEGAGGIGGLLAVHQIAGGTVPAGDYAYCYDEAFAPSITS